MIRILDRYLFLQLLPPFGVALLTFVVLISGHFLWQATQIIVQHRVPPVNVLYFVLLQMPRATVLAVPVATLLACSLVVSRLAAENELTAISTGGVSTMRICLPLLVLGLLACLACLGDSELLIPAADQQSRVLMNRILFSRKSLSIRPRTFIDAGNGVYLYAADVDTRRDILTNLVTFVVPSKGPVLARWTPQARFKDTGIEIEPGLWYCFAADGSFTWGHDNGGRLALAGLPAAGTLGGHTLGNLSMRELLRRARDLEGRYPGQGVRYLVELHWRLALSISPLIFALLALPVASKMGRRESLIGVLATIIIVFVYFVIMLWMRILGDAGRLPPAVAAWSLNLVICCLALIGIYKCH